MRLSKILDDYGNLFYLNLDRINCIRQSKDYKGCALIHEGYTIYFRIDAEEVIKELKNNQMEI